ncbi:MAG TPA: hypothetical protein VII38_09995 [Polyangia bacterium]
MRTLMVAGLVALGGLALGGCYGELHAAYPRGEVAVPFGPPAPVAQVPSPQPAIGTIWTAGYWDWRPSLHRYQWMPGRWVRPPRPGVVYLPPRWEESHRRWRRLPARWIRGQAYDRYGRTVWFDTLGRPHSF